MNKRNAVATVVLAGALAACCFGLAGCGGNTYADNTRNAVNASASTVDAADYQAATLSAAGTERLNNFYEENHPDYVDVD